MTSRAALACFIAAIVPAAALAQSCPEPLASAHRLVLVTADDMSKPAATVQWFERASASEPWRKTTEPEPALVGKTGIAWSPFFRKFAAGGEPVKVEGDKRAPAGFYGLRRAFGHASSLRANYTQLVDGTTCVDDPSSPAYNTITSRSRIGWEVHGENMWRVPDYRHGLFVDYPTSAKARAGSCIFVHIRRPGMTGTGGCVALPEARVEAMQAFAEPGAVIAILPRAALSRFRGCLPAIN
jgi:L,D-peptidoglycan transpeptidase YkuD (ErfK/YbiS/YcfS/YnhG family)